MCNSSLFLDGSDTVRELQLYMSPEAEHILDWHHLTMRLTVLDQYGKGLVHCDHQRLGEVIRHKIERLKWAL
jgi:virulence-associated protein VapD